MHEPPADTGRRRHFHVRLPRLIAARIMASGEHRPPLLFVGERAEEDVAGYARGYVPARAAAAALGASRAASRWR